MQNRGHFAGILYIVEDPLEPLLSYFGVFFVMIEKFNNNLMFKLYIVGKETEGLF